MIIDEAERRPIAAWAGALTTQIDDRQRLAHLQDQYDAFETQRTEIRRLAESLTQLVRVWRAFRQEGLIDLVVLSEVRAAREQVRALTEAFTESPASIATPQRLNGLRSSVGRVAASLEARLLQAWTAHAKSQIPAVDDDVLAVLGHIPSLQQQVSRVREGRQELLRVAEKLPSGDSDLNLLAAIAEFRRRAAVVTAAWEAFDTEHLPPDVLQFLRLAGTQGGAPVATFSASIRDWLTNHRLTSSFVVRAVVAGRAT